MGPVWDAFLSVEWGLSGMRFCPLNGACLGWVSVRWMGAVWDGFLFVKWGLSGMGFCSLNGGCLGWVSVR